jgi:hypothetical protein
MKESGSEAKVRFGEGDFAGLGSGGLGLLVLSSSEPQ